LFTIDHEVVLTNQPLGLSKRGIKQRHLKTINKLYLATAFAQTMTGNYFRVKVGQKQWWLAERDMNQQSIDVLLTNNYRVNLSDYLNVPVSQALIFNQTSEQMIRSQFNTVPDDLVITDGYRTVQLVDNQPVYQLYSEKFDESVMVPVNEVFVLDTTHFDEVYAVNHDTIVDYQVMLLSQESQQIAVKDHIVEIARVWNWQTEYFLIYGQLYNQYGWFDVSLVLTNE